MIVTSQVNHATPASYLTHNESRRNYNAIADSYIDGGIKTDLIFGGGWKYFIREDRNLVDEFKSKGFHYIDNYQGLKNLPPNTPIMGLFADVGLPWALDDSNSLRLSEMTKAATEQLENKQGYFMLIEASQIDWAGHANDIASAMAEMTDLAKTLEFLEQYVKSHPDTLVVLTADHSTGGFSIAANGKYEWHPGVLRSLTQSPKEIANSLSKQSISAKIISELLNFVVSETEAKLVRQAKQAAIEKLTLYSQLEKDEQEKMAKPNIRSAIYLAVNKLIDKRTNTGWTTGGHTAIDVPVFAFGKNSEMFKGNIDNTDVGKTIFTLLNIK